MNGKLSTLWFPLFLWSVTLIIYYSFFFARAHVEVEIRVEQRTWFKIYWAEENKPFSEKNMVRVRVSPEKRNYELFLTDLRDVERLRIDTHQYQGSAVLRRLHISQKTLQDISFDTSEELALLQPLDQINKVTIDDGSMTVESAGKDPNFLFMPQLQSRPYSPVEEGGRAVALGFVVFFLYWGSSTLIANLRFIPICLAVVLVLVATMAFISEENVHPDEFVHAPAAEYYSQHWLPPAPEDQGIRHTYSPYGASRLNTDEIYYLLCGKVGQLVEPLKLSYYVTYRVFNVLLLFSVLLYLFRVVDARIMAIPFLISPQVWYLYSYCNSDGFALVVAFFAGCQVVLRNSVFNRWLRSAGGAGWLPKMVLLGLGFGLLLLVKKNYWPFAALLALIVILNWLRLQDAHERRAWLRRALLVAVIALAVFGSKLAANYYVNGVERSVKIAEVRRELAQHMFNPATPLAETHPHLYLKQKGVPLSKLVTSDRWFEKTFRSAVGVYGYFTISGGDTYYNLMRWSGVCLLAFLFGSVLVRGDMWDRGIALAVAGMSTLLIAASLYHSWTGDFQTQGRYRFPVLAMLALVAGRNSDLLSRRWLGLLVMTPFMISLYSFIAVALHEIPRLTVH